MPDTLLIAITIALYLAATAFTAVHLRTANKLPATNNKKNINIGYAFAWLASLCHGLLAFHFSLVNNSINLGLSSMVVLVSALLTIIFLMAGLAMPIRRLGILVYPLTVISLLFSSIWGKQVITLSNTSLAFNAHILMSLLAYSILAIASIQALLYFYQERQIKNRTEPAMLMALPPLQTMEQLLFRLVGFGFFNLTLTLVSGAFFSQEIFGHAFALKHHTILAILGWLVFATLLFKRVKDGLRGTQAVIFTVSGFVLIQLGYFGTKIVSESLGVQ